jgi:hypothetical protein
LEDAFLWHVGRPQSKEEEERNQERLQWIIKRLDPEKAEEFIKGNGGKIS